MCVCVCVCVCVCARACDLCVHTRACKRVTHFPELSYFGQPVSCGYHGCHVTLPTIYLTHACLFVTPAGTMQQEVDYVRRLTPALLEVSKTSPFDGVRTTLVLRITAVQWWRWQQGLPIQYAMPDLSADEREFLISGIPPGEFPSE